MNVSVFFCDDIRAEQDGRHSYMGIFDPVFKSKRPQVLLPRFCVHAEMLLNDGEVPTDSHLIIKKGSEVIGEFPFITDKNRPQVSNSTKTSIRVEMSVSPLILKIPTSVSAYFRANGEEKLVRQVEFIMMEEGEKSDTDKKKGTKKTAKTG